jgi:hypothetical protein
MKVKRHLMIACTLAAVAGPCALSAQASSAAPAALRAYGCSPNVQPLLRGLDVTAVMRPLAGTQTLRMRFDLLRASRRSGRYRAVHAKNLGHWISPSDPALGRQPGDVWNVTHPVVGVARPGYYRLQVAFEWLGPKSRRLALVTRSTPACALLELRPDLLVSSIAPPTPIAGRPGKDVYLAAIRNRGATAAGSFAVALSVAGGPPVTHTVTGLGPHSGRHVSFVAPACTAGDAITVTVEPPPQMLDGDVSNNSLTVVCPSPG